MAITKAEAEDQFRQYHGRLAEARIAETGSNYREAVRLALSCCAFVEGMTQYVRRYQKEEVDSISAFDIILRYSPLLLDFESLNTVAALLKDRPRIDKITTENIGEQLDRAMVRMWKVHSLWDHLEANGEVRQSDLARTLGGDQTEWRSIAESLARMNLLERSPESATYRLRLTTRLSGMINAKCPRCGAITEAPKAMLLEDTRCPSCRSTVLFALLSPVGAANPEAK